MIMGEGLNHSMSSRSSSEPDPEPVSILAVGLKLDTVIEYGCNSSPTGVVLSLAALKQGGSRHVKNEFFSKKAAR